VPALLSELRVWTEPVLPAAPVAPATTARLKRALGGIPNTFEYITSNEFVVELELASFELPFTTLTVKDYYQVALVTSQENACRHCYGMTRAGLRIFGLSSRQIARIERDLDLTEADPKRQLMLRFCRRLARSMPRPARADREALEQAGHSPAQVAELAVAVAIATVSNRINTLLAVPVPERLERLVNRFAPILRLFIRPPRPMPAPQPIQNQGPFAPILAALGDIPFVYTLRNVIDLAFASPVLPRRTKALMLAVVGRSLGCTGSECEAKALLEAEGSSVGELDSILANLSTPGSDPVESALLVFARDSVRYQPQEIQPRMHQLRDQIGPDRLLEAVGVAALGNALVRIAMMQL
jgi:AhpD family alkylhydroperoxidase